MSLFKIINLIVSVKADKKAEITKITKQEQERLVCLKILI